MTAETTAQDTAIVAEGGPRGRGVRRVRALDGRPWWAPKSKALARLLLVVLLLVLWEVLYYLWGDPLFMAPPSQVVFGIVAVLQQPAVVDAILLAVYEIVVAFALAVVFGLIIGLVVGLNRFLLETFQPLIMMLYSIPQAPFLPLFVLAFGIEATSKIAYGFTHGIFVMTVTVIAGVQSIDQSLIRAAHSMGASRWQIMTNVVMPTALRAFFTGTRLGLTGVILGVLLAELFITTGGIGYYTRMFTNTFEPEMLFGLITIVAAIAVTMNEAARRAEIRASRWRDA